MNRAAFQALARERIADSRVLLEHRRFQAAHYLAGYAVECALKACVAKRTMRFDFPDKDRANGSHSHDFQNLLRHADLDADLNAELVRNQPLERNWSMVKEWRPDSRYLGGRTGREAKDFYTAVNGRTGIMRWLRKRW